MTLQHIKYFITTAECLSFTEAAEQLYITQPALSRQIIAMETELNVLLFLRHKNHKIELTPAGAILLKKFKNIYEIYTESIVEAQKLAFNITGSLKIGVLDETYIGDFMPDIMQELMKQYPNIHVTLKHYSFGELTKCLYNGELDIVFTLFFSVKELDKLNFHIMTKCKDGIVMTNRHPLANVDFELSDLKKERFIVVSKEDSGNSASLIMNEFHNKNIYPEFIYAPDINTLSLMVESGYGIAVIDSRHTLRFHPNIVFREFESSWDPSLTAVWHHDNSNPILPVLIKLLKKVRIV